MLVDFRTATGSYNGRADYFRTIPMEEMNWRIKAGGEESRKLRSLKPFRGHRSAAPGGATGKRDRPSPLHPRLEKLAAHIVQGKTREQIAELMGWSKNRVTTEWHEIRDVTETKSVAALRRYLDEFGIPHG